MTRWLITGARGALGSDLVGVLADSGDEAIALDHQALDIGDETAVTETFDFHRPDVVVNAAAYTQVDEAESDEASAMRVNGDAPGHLARWCAANRSRLVHVSTDYVFDGRAIAPYDVDAPTAPCNAYGRSKLAGEQAVLASRGDGHVVRTAWVYGSGPSFVRSVGGRLRAGDPVDVVTDQRGAPTWSLHLARRLVVLGTADVPPGLWHCTAGGEASWYDVALVLADLLGVARTLVRPTTSATMSRPARRPAYSVLSNEKWISHGLPPMPTWQTMLTQAVDELGARLIG